jgi:hypothetical protein
MQEVENRTIPSTKNIPTALYNPHWFRVMTKLHEGESFNGPWFIHQNLIPLVKKFCQWVEERTKTIGRPYRQCASPLFKDNSKLFRIQLAEEIFMSTFFTAHFSSGILPIRKNKRPSNPAKDFR